MAQYNDAEIRAQFPEVASETQYPQSQLQAQWMVAKLYLDGNYDNPCRTLNGDSLQYALNCLALHLYSISLQSVSEASSEGGDLGGNQGGFVNSASVGDVSVSKDSFPAKDAWDWWLGQTPYGQALLSLLSVLAVGGFSVGGMPESEGFRRSYGLFL